MVGCRHRGRVTEALVYDGTDAFAGAGLARVGRPPRGAGRTAVVPERTQHRPHS